MKAIGNWHKIYKEKLKEINHTTYWLHSQMKDYISRGGMYSLMKGEQSPTVYQHEKICQILDIHL